ncbi:MAG: ATP-dependent RecD-like DNA helicase [Flavobacteriales bacterium]|jgi:exodeoxyribonuclease-5
MSHSISQEVFESRLVHHFGLIPTDGQARLFHVFTRFAFSAKPKCALLVKGYAGTGKTTSVKAMVRTLEECGLGVGLLAPTGRAAKVLASYSGKPAYTIHKQIYMRKMDRSGRMWFDLLECPLKNTVFFVDEASMIGNEMQDKGEDIVGGELLEDLLAYVFSGENCRVVFIGDSAQLPPVGCALSPALDLDLLRDRYDLNIAEVELTEVMRQQQGSWILDNATAIRRAIAHGSAETPLLITEPGGEMEAVTGDVQPYVEDALRVFGVDDLIILTRSNKRANLFNQQMRVRVLGHEEEINSGDRMMVVRNNYFWLEGQALEQAGFMANGDIIEVLRVRHFIDRGAFRFCKAVVRMVDYPDLPEMEVLLWCDAINAETANLGMGKIRALNEEIALDYADLDSPAAKRKAIRQDPFYNALQVKFAYAVTVHKAQGGQWPCVFVDRGFVTPEMLGPEFNRWLYTAITRAQEKVLLVGFDPEFLREPAHPESLVPDQDNL